MRRLGLGLGFLTATLALYHTAKAQEGSPPLTATGRPMAQPSAPPPVPPGELVVPIVPNPPFPRFDGPADPAPRRNNGLEPESLPAEIVEDEYTGPPPYRVGPTPVSEVNILMDRLGLRNVFGDSNIRSFGWMEMGYSGASSGSGLLSVQPRQNRFGNQFLFNQIGLAIQKPLRQDQFDIGFGMRYFAGADAALGQPRGGIGYPAHNPRFGQDFRDLYISMHLPILTEGGLDVKAGRMNTIIGYNGFLSPYRPLYSSDYQFFYSQDGAFTGVLGNLHVNSRLDVWSGLTFGANTFFTKRSPNSLCYIGQVNYWLNDDQRTRLTASVYCGQDALFAAPGLAGKFDTMVELRVQQNWSDRLTQIVQSNMGWDSSTPVGTGSWYGIYSIGIYHLTSQIDLISRVEWFDDVRGTRTGVNTNFSETTLGLNWHPTSFLEFRPEIRGDFAADPAYGINGQHTHYSQLSGGISVLVKF